MTSIPIWLPEMVSVNGEWLQVVCMLYGIFTNDFKHITRYFRESKICWDPRKENGDPYEEIFWHLITKTDYSIGDRLPDFGRAKRLPWCGPTISNCDDSNVKVWDYIEGRNNIRTYIWLWEYDYVIVLEPRKKNKLAYLVTAYHVEGEQTRKSLQSKYQNRLV